MRKTLEQKLDRLVETSGRREKFAASEKTKQAIVEVILTELDDDVKSVDVIVYDDVIDSLQVTFRMKQLNVDGNVIDFIKDLAKALCTSIDSSHAYVCLKGKNLTMHFEQDIKITPKLRKKLGDL